MGSDVVNAGAGLVDGAAEAVGKRVLSTGDFLFCLFHPKSRKCNPTLVLWKK